MILLSYTTKLKTDGDPVEIRYHQWFESQSKANRIIRKMIKTNRDKGIVTYKNIHSMNTTTNSYEIQK